MRNFVFYSLSYLAKFWKLAKLLSKTKKREFIIKFSLRDGKYLKARCFQNFVNEKITNSRFLVFQSNFASFQNFASSVPFKNLKRIENEISHLDFRLLPARRLTLDWSGLYNKKYIQEQWFNSPNEDGNCPNYPYYI